MYLDILRLRSLYIYISCRLNIRRVVLEVVAFALLHVPYDPNQMTPNLVVLLKKSSTFAQIVFKFVALSQILKRSASTLNSTVNFAIKLVQGLIASSAASV